MNNFTLFIALLCLFITPSFSQIKFSDETKKYIEYNDPVIVFKNGLLIDGKGNAAKPQQTVIISHGKIDWIGDDTKAIIPKGATILDLMAKPSCQVW